ncbi:DUF6474 family protein [Pseudonocardia sp.]|uniref:DUF6474 family protein n=1 Tax=Pseudonocardia sp. TaxID=60912 RepID=UPI003D0A2F6A
MGLRRRAGSRANGAGPDPGTEGSLGAGPPAADLVGASKPARERKPLTAAKAKRLIGVGTAVAPLIAPYAMAAAGAARARWDAHRAARLGVPPDQLVSYASRGGALHARLSRIAETLTALDERGDEARRFAADVRPRLADLAVAVRAAEQMPSARRRTAFRAIGDELDRIEADLLTQLGVDT